MVTIKLNASAEAALDWKVEIAQAQESQGSIMWELDFGIDGSSLFDDVRYLSLELAVQHFTSDVWPHFSECSEGVVFYRGALNLHNRETRVEYLVSLAAHLPLEATPYLVLDTDQIPDAMTFFKLISPDQFGSLKLRLEGEWAERYPYALVEGTPLAVCPPDNQDWTDVLEALGTTPFRVIPEKLLTQEWDGVDDLVVFSKFMSDKGRRKLLGFCAAEGRVLTVGPPQHLPNETPFEG